MRFRSSIFCMYSSKNDVRSNLRVAANLVSDAAGFLSGGQALAYPVSRKSGNEKEIPVHHKLEEYIGKE
jgi:hypothetical protein